MQTLVKGTKLVHKQHADETAEILHVKDNKFYVVFTSAQFGATGANWYTAEALADSDYKLSC